MITHKNKTEKRESDDKEGRNKTDPYRRIGKIFPADPQGKGTECGSKSPQNAEKRSFSGKDSFLS